MSWRTAKAQMASGTYDVPGDQAGAGFAQGFASAFVPAINDAIDGYVNEKREMRLTEHAEALARQRAAIGAARSASSDADKALKERLANLETAKSLAATLGLAATDDNLMAIYNEVVANDGDGSQTLNALREQQDTGVLVLEPNSAPAPSETIVDQAAETVQEDLSAADPATPTTPNQDATEVEMSALTGVGQATGFASPQPAEEGVRVASLTDEVLIEMALSQDKPVQDQGEEAAVRVADASGIVGGAESVTFTDAARAGATVPQTASILRFNTAVTPFSQLSNETEIQANLLALEGRTDSFATTYRANAMELLGRITKLPDIATMDRAQREAYINGGYEQYADYVPEENLAAHVEQARKFQQSGQSMPPIPPTLEEKEALSQSIQSGVFGPIENIPASYLANLNSYIVKDRAEAQLSEQFGDVLSVPNLIGSELSDLTTLKQVLSNAGLTNSTLEGIIRSREEEERNSEYKTYATGVTTSQEAISQLSIAMNSGASAQTITALEDLRDSLTANEAVRSASENGQQTEAVLSRVVIDGKSTVREVIRFPNGTGPNGQDYIIPGMEDAATPTVYPMSEQATSAFLDLRKENSILIKDAYAANEGLAQGLRNASNVLDIATTNPLVLTSGADAAQVVTRGVRGAGSLFDVAQSLLAGKSGDYTVTIEQMEAALNGTGLSLTDDFVNGLVTSDVQDLASQTTLFEAQVLLLAFRMGSLEGQSGAAMSNKDFDRLMSIVDTSNGSIETFTSKLHEYMNEKIVGYDDKVFNVNSQLNDFKNTFGYEVADLVVPFDQFVAGRNEAQLTQAYELFSQPLAKAGNAASDNPPATSITLDTVRGMTVTDIESLLEDANAIKGLPDAVFNALMERAATLEAGDQ